MRAGQTAAGSRVRLKTELEAELEAELSTSPLAAVCLHDSIMEEAERERRFCPLL